MKKLILTNYQSPGDIVMLTAAVRDLHHAYPESFVTDVRTPCPELWANNPFITPLREDDSEVQIIKCHYPLIHQSNQTPFHFIHGFIQYLSSILRLDIKPTAFKGDIYLSKIEKNMKSQVANLIGEDIPFWIIVAGGKYDFTTKWWAPERYQKVVDHFTGKMVFVQVGEKGHFHPPLKGVIDLRGETNLQQLLYLVYHSQGVLCPVTLAMHLAASIEVKNGISMNRPCVVIAGGREPPHWEAYPNHQYIHTNGALACCQNGGCWKSRVLPLGDGDDNDQNLCVDVIDRLPRCLHMIRASDVVRRVEMYFEGGSIKYLTPPQWKAAAKFIIV